MLSFFKKFARQTTLQGNICKSCWSHINFICDIKLSSQWKSFPVLGIDYTIRFCVMCLQHHCRSCGRTLCNEHSSDQMVRFFFFVLLFVQNISGSFTLDELHTAIFFYVGFTTIWHLLECPSMCWLFQQFTVNYFLINS